LKVFVPEKGGNYEAFSERPLREELRRYCVQDVRCLPGLFGVYVGRLGFGGKGKWEVRIKEESERRIVENIGKEYQSHGQQKAFAPTW